MTNLESKVLNVVTCLTGPTLIRFKVINIPYVKFHFYEISFAIIGMVIGLYICSLYIWLLIPLQLGQSSETFSRSPTSFNSFLPRAFSCFLFLAYFHTYCAAINILAVHARYNFGCAHKRPLSKTDLWSLAPPSELQRRVAVSIPDTTKGIVYP